MGATERTKVEARHCGAYEYCTGSACSCACAECSAAKALPKADPECPRCGGPATPAGRGVMFDTPCPHHAHDDPK